MNDSREKVARAIWNVMRDHEDRCDMELEDMGDSHPIWEYADAALAATPAAAAPVVTTIPDAAYCALQYVEHALAAIANREELVEGTIERVDTIGKASKRAKAALTRLQAVAHHFNALEESPAAAAPQHQGMTIAGNGAAELGKLMREQWETRGGVYPDGNPNAGQP